MVWTLTKKVTIVFMCHIPQPSHSHASHSPFVKFQHGIFPIHYITFHMHHNGTTHFKSITCTGFPHKSHLCNSHQIHHGIGHIVGYPPCPQERSGWVPSRDIRSGDRTPSSSWASELGTPLVTSGGSHWKWSMYGFQAGGTHPIGMLSCFIYYSIFLYILIRPYSN